MSAEPVRVAICDDSNAYGQGLRRFLETDPRLRVVTVVTSGEQLLSELGEHRPQLIMIDVALPGIGGIEAIRRIVATMPVAVVVISSHVNDGLDPLVPAAIAAGARSAVDKAELRLDQRLMPRGVALREHFLRLAGREPRGRPPTPLVRPDARTAPAAGNGATAAPAPLTPVVAPDPPPSPPVVRRSPLPQRGVATIIGIAASAGGPNALGEVLGALPADYRLPVLVVQHISEGFAAGLASWLDGVIPLGVRLAREGELPGPGVLIAPDGAHLVLDGDGRVHLDRRGDPGAHRPSANALLTSLATIVGRGVVAVVLTGMGRDGADGVAAVRQAGGVALAERSENAHLSGMPVAAAQAGATPLDRAEIGRTLAALSRSSEVA